MIATAFVLAASSSAALSNLFIRLNLSKGGSPKVFIAFFYLLSLGIAIALNPEIFSVPFSFPPALAGATVGLLNVFLMWLTTKAVTTGPSGLTFAFQNSSAVFPPLILFLLFGPEFDYSVSLIQMLGMGLVVVGLFYSAKGTKENSIPLKWFKFAVGCFFIQGLALTLIQWRCLFFTSHPDHLLIPAQCSILGDAWFVPSIFAIATLVQFLLFLREAKRPTMNEICFGILGGLTNGASAFLLALATKFAFSFEKIILFPLFAVSVILLCNLWGKFVYQERINLISNGLCAVGILIAAFG